MSRPVLSWSIGSLPSFSSLPAPRWALLPPLVLPVRLVPSRHWRLCSCFPRGPRAAAALQPSPSPRSCLAAARRSWEARPCGPPTSPVAARPETRTQDAKGIRREPGHTMLGNHRPPAVACTTSSLGGGDQLGAGLARAPAAAAAAHLGLHLSAVSLPVPNSLALDERWQGVRLRSTRHCLVCCWRPPRCSRQDPVYPLNF